MSLIRSGFSSYSSLNQANILEYWMSSLVPYDLGIKSSSEVFFLPVDNWNEGQQ